MAKQLDFYTNMLEALTWSMSHYIATDGNEKTDFNKECAKELTICMESEIAMESIRSFYNALMFTDDSADLYWMNKKGDVVRHSYMLGHENVHGLFPGTIKKFPNLTKLLTIYVYS